MSDARWPDGVLHALPLGLVVLDEAARVVAWNEWMERQSGITHHVAHGQTLEDLFAGSLAARLMDAIHRALGAGTSAALAPEFTPHPFPLTRPARPDQLMVQSVIVLPLRGERFEMRCLVEVHDASAATERVHRLRHDRARLRHRLARLQACLPRARAAGAREPAGPLAGSVPAAPGPGGVAPPPPAA